MQLNSAESLRVNFVKEREAAYKRIFKRSPLVSSASIGWKDLGFDIAFERLPRPYRSVKSRIPHKD